MPARLPPIVFAVSAVCLLAAACGRNAGLPGAGEPAPPYALAWWAPLPAHDEDGTEAPPTPMRLGDLATGADAFALGMASGDAGIITVVEGARYTAHTEDGREVITQSDDIEIAWLIHGEVTAWRSMPIPATVTTPAALVAWVSHAALEAGLDAAHALPFRVSCSAAWVAYHLPSADAEGAMMAYSSMDGDRVTLVGVVNPPHTTSARTRGPAAIFHALNHDGTRSGRVDDFELHAAAVVWLPAP